MKTKRNLLYLIVATCIGYLIYVNVFTRSCCTMYHHFGFYDSFSKQRFFVSIVIQAVVFLVLAFSTIMILKMRKTQAFSYVDILNKRLATGEITQDEYHKIIHAVQNESQS